MSKIIAALILSSIVSWKFHSDRSQRVTMGRTAFLANQGAFYDKHYQHDHAWLVDYLAISFSFGVTITIYECLSFGISRIAKSPASQLENEHLEPVP